MIERAIRVALGLSIAIGGIWSFGMWAESSWPYSGGWADPLMAIGAFFCLFAVPPLGLILAFAPDLSTQPTETSNERA